MPTNDHLWEGFCVMIAKKKSDTPNGRRICYARVSTKEQKINSQIDLLKASGCDLIFKDHGVSGAKASRKGLDGALKALKSGDTLVVYRLDRLGRSVLHLADLLKHFEETGIKFCSLTEGINTATSGGKLVYHLFSAMAEFQRELIRENTIHGIQAARARGKKIGRPFTLDDAIVNDARFLMDTHKISVAKAANLLAIPRSTLARALKR